jgi:NADH-quinone oxidoreductase subunit G
MFGAPGFDAIDRSEQVRDDVLGGQGLASTPRHDAAPLRAGLNNGLNGPVNESASVHSPAKAPVHASAHATTLERIAELPLYAVDGIVRRSEALQATRAARTPQALIASATLAGLGLAAGDEVLVADQGQLTQSNGGAPAAAARLTLAVDDRLPAGCVRVDGGHPATVAAGAWSGVVTVTRA